MSKLYIVPTPIGNLKDITLRAIDVLNSVDFILAEDTRKTGILLKHYKIENRLRSFHKFNEHKTLSNIITELREGLSIALVSDAGTPGISDPGFLLVRECIVQDIEVETLPGATAFIPALINSGLPCERFCFEGFLPQKKGRNKKMEALVNEERTMIFYESPHRLIKTLELIKTFLGEDRIVSVSRELSKIHEENIRGKVVDVIKHYSDNTLKGEIVLIIQGKN